MVKSIFTGTAKLGVDAAVDASVNEASTTVYRAVDATEAASINNTGQFFLQEGGTEVKYFAQSVEDAHWYGQQLYPNGYSIIQGTVMPSVDASKYWFPYIDIGAYAFPKDVLPNIIPH